MTELEKIAYARSFIDKLANGINPLDDTPVPESDIVNNIRLSRCFFYVSDILRQVIENGGTVPKKKRSQKSPFFITHEQLAGYSYSELPISVSEIAKRINMLIDTENMKSLSYSQLAKWLIGVNVLVEQTSDSGKPKKVPTEEGKRLGVSLELRSGMRGEYWSVLYNVEAQKFIIDNIDSIMASVQLDKSSTDTDTE